jgi:purine-nucleoside phosphorylase
MPARLRPTAPITAAAVLVGDPGRALMLAQELLEQPKMSNHARGLWGYSGRTPAGGELTIQATGIGGPSAAVVLADLAELGVRRAVRIGTCTALTAELAPGTMLEVVEAHAWGGPGGREGAPLRPDPELAQRLGAALGTAGHPGVVASLDVLHAGGAPAPVGAGDVADMQTAALLGRGGELEVAVAAVLIVTEGAKGERLVEDAEIDSAKRAGAAAVLALSTSS